MRANLFDLDRTLIRKNLSFSFYFYLLKEGIVSKATLLRTIPLYFQHRFGFLDLKGIHHRVFDSILKGQLLQTLEAAADRFVEPFVRQMLHPKLFSELLSAKERGEAVFLLSSSAEFLVGRVAKLFGFDRFVGTQYSVDKEGRLCDISTLITGSTKLAIAKLWTEEQCYTLAYSDSSDDLPLLQWADQAIAVCPDRLLRSQALKQGWMIVGKSDE